MMITPLSIIILALMAIAIIWTLAFGLRPMWITGKKMADMSPSESETRRPLTVVVFASCDTDVLDRWIERILRQDYENFDVVVVYDANAENTSILAERYAAEKRLYFTFIPPGSHTLNRRKLALTIGIKAAKGEYILTTVPQVEIPSDRWISEMMGSINRPDSPIEVVLGFSRFDVNRMSAITKLYASIETVTEGARWIGDALRNRAWRGDGNNLIFRKSLFFENKGFADGLLLEGGDDDLFVERITREDNTAVSLMPETVLTLNWGSVTDRVWKFSRRRYRSTRPLMPRGPRVARDVSRWCSWLMPLAAVGAVAADWLAWLPIVIASLFLIVFYVCELVAYNRASRRLNGLD